MEAKLGHQCDLWSFNINDDSLTIFEELEILEDSIPNSVKETLVYIAGYVAFKTDAKSSEDTFIYYERFGKFTNELSRGKLRIPNDTLCQFTFFACVLFGKVKTHVCRTSLVKVLKCLTDYYHFEIDKRCVTILSNIFLNNYTSFVTPRSSREPKQKVLKLS